MDMDKAQIIGTVEVQRCLSMRLYRDTSNLSRGISLKKAAHRAEVWPDGDSTAKLHGNFAVSQ
jgi:hypothetical protein